MANITWCSFYFRKDIGSNKALEKTRENAPKSLIEAADQHYEPRDLNLEYSEEHNCVYWYARVSDSLDKFFREWLKQIEEEIKVGYICKFSNTSFTGSVDIFIPTRSTIRRVEQRKGVLRFFEEDSPKMYAYEMYEINPDEDRDHFVELESTYGEKPFVKFV